MHCYADDCQIFIPLKQNDSHCVQILLQSLSNIKAWMALNAPKVSPLERVATTYEAGNHYLFLNLI